MSKTEQVRVRIEPHIKSQASEILEELGFTMSDAVSIFMRQVISHRGLPFEVKIPNAETRAAIEASRRGEGERMTLEEVRASLLD